MSIHFAMQTFQGFLVTAKTVEEEIEKRQMLPPLKIGFGKLNMLGNRKLIDELPGINQTVSVLLRIV